MILPNKQRPLSVLASLVSIYTRDNVNNPSDSSWLLIYSLILSTLLYTAYSAAKDSKLMPWILKLKNIGTLESKLMHPAQVNVS